MNGEQTLGFYDTTGRYARNGRNGYVGMGHNEDELRSLSDRESTNNGATTCPRCGCTLYIITYASSEEDDEEQQSASGGDEKLGESEGVLQEARNESSGTGNRGMGEDKTQGQRSDLDTVAKLIIEGKQMKEIAEAFPSTFIRTHKGLGALHQVLHKPQHILRKVGLFYGATETGKRERCSNASTTFTRYST